MRQCNSPLGREELISKMRQKMQSSWSCYRVDLVSPRSFLEYFHEYENHTYKKIIKKIPNRRILSTMNKEGSSIVCDLRSWTNTIENFSSSGTRCILYLLKNHIMFIFESINGVNDIDMAGWEENFNRFLCDLRWYRYTSLWIEAIQSVLLNLSFYHTKHWEAILINSIN